MLATGRRLIPHGEESVRRYREASHTAARMTRAEVRKIIGKRRLAKAYKPLGFKPDDIFDAPAKGTLDRRDYEDLLATTVLALERREAGAFFAAFGHLSKRFARDARVSGAERHQEVVMIEDFMGSVTKNEVGGGHPLIYYESRRADGFGIHSPQYHEAFANWFALTTSPNRYWQSAFRALLPEIDDAFNEVLRKRAGPASGPAGDPDEAF